MINNSIFAPHYDRVIDKKDGTVKFVPHIIPGQKDFDQYYIDKELVMVVKPVEGGTDEDYILVPTIKESKRLIEEVINSQADDVGLENCLRKFALTGDPSVLPSPVNATDQILDLTALPQDSADYFKYIHALAASFEQLPLDLRKDYSMEDFTAKVINGEIDVTAYLTALSKKEDKLKEGE